MEQSSKDYFKNNIKLLEIALRQWKFLLVVAIVAGGLAAVFSSPKFIAPKFTSEAVIYPANLGGYSGETRLEQMMQYTESNAIRDSIIRKFKLYEEYEIDSTQRTSRNAIYLLYDEHISADETQFESINITATSTSPEKAAAIVQEFIEQLDKTIRRNERAKFKEQLVINERLMNQKKKQLDSLETLIRKYSTEYGILDYLVQTEEVTKGYMKFLLEGKKGKDFEEVKRLYENLQKYGRHYHDINAQLNIINGEYINRMHNYEHTLKDYNKVQSHSYVLVSPEVPDKKSYPIRWLIVLVGAASATFFAFVVILIRASSRQ